MTSHPNIKEEKLAYYTSNGRARMGAQFLYTGPYYSDMGGGVRGVWHNAGGLSTSNRRLCSAVLAPFDGTP